MTTYNYGDLVAVQGNAGGTVPGFVALPDYLSAADFDGAPEGHLALASTKLVTLREFGNAITVSSDIPDGEGMARLILERHAERLITGLRVHSAPLFQSGGVEIVEGPVTDLLGRTRQLGYRVTLGSEQMDYWGGIFRGDVSLHWGTEPSFKKAWVEFKQAISSLIGGVVLWVRGFFGKGTRK